MCIRERGRPRRRSLAGVSYIELIVFIIVVAIAVVGVLRVFNQTSQKSGDPQVRKQMLAAAEALLEEIELKPFTFCDPDDANATTATSATQGAAVTQCAVQVEQIGPEAAFTGQTGNETRTSATAPFDNVNDYDGLSLPTITDINGVTLPGYSASVSVTTQQIEASVPASETLRIVVTVTRAGGESLSLTGYRMRYAPRAVP